MKVMAGKESGSGRVVDVRSGNADAGPGHAFRSAFASPNVCQAVIVLDSAGTIHGCSPGVEVLFGYARAELCGRPVALLLPQLSNVAPFSAGKANPQLVRLSQSRTRFAARRCDGERLICELVLGQASNGLLPVVVRSTRHRLSAVTTAARTGKGIAGSFADVAIAHRAPSPKPASTCADPRIGEPPAGRPALLILDVDGRVAFASADAEQLFGRSRAALAGMPIGQVIPELPLRAETPGYNLAYARFGFAGQEGRRFRGICAKGEVHPLDVFLEVVSLGGQPWFVVEAERGGEFGRSGVQGLQAMVAATSRERGAIVQFDATGRLAFAPPLFKALPAPGAVRAAPGTA